MPKDPLNPVSPSPGTPLYIAVRDELRSAIDAGVFEAGAQLPSTKALAERLQVSLVTVHRALRELGDLGVVRRGQGKGTFVHEGYASRSRGSVGLRFALVFQAESSLADSYHGQILEGVRQGAERLGIDLVVLHFGEDWRNECQGFLYVNPLQRQLGPGMAHMGRAPVLTVGASFDGTSAHCVDVDNIELARVAVQQIAAAGFTRIGFIGDSDENSNSRHRWLGFQQACAELGIQINPDWCVRVPGWRLTSQARDRLAHVLTQSQRPQAFFAAGYYFALDLYGVAGEFGLRIPTDVSVVGVDDPPSAEFLSPPLSTMRQPLVEMGRIAVSNLFDLVAQRAPAHRRVLLSAEFVSRGSLHRNPAGAPGIITRPATESLDKRRKGPRP